MPIEGGSLDRERVLRTLTFWLRPAFALRVVNRFQRIAGFDRAVALASSALTALIPLAVVSGAVLERLGVKDVPDRIIDKQKVGFFNSAVGAWFRAQTDGVITDYLLRPDPAYGELVDRTEVERLVAKHGRGEAPGSAHALLSILMLEIWLSEFLPRASTVTPVGRERIEVPA